jgi:uncharacterized protein DUF4153
MTDPAPAADPVEDPRPTLMEERLSAVAAADAAPLPLGQPPIVARELVALLLIVGLSDLTIYRGHGYAGLGLLFTVAPLLILVGIVPRRFDGSSWMLAPLLVLTSIRLVWCGSPAAVVAGFALLCGYGMGLSGLKPHVIQVGVFAAHLITAGHRGLHLYAKSLARYSPKILRANWIAVILPAVTLVVFGTIFVMANPDLVKSFGTALNDFVEWLEQWLTHFQLAEILFCLGIAWIAIGLLRPDVKQVSMAGDAVYVSVESEKAPLYEAFRNTLVMVIGLFAVYLVFEFQTLWFREFPKGFHYSGYAHEGAAWLTVALGLATLLLSMIFRGRVLDDPRLRRLRMLSWVWSIENFLLVVAVFNRLFIYIGFNGMTRMRVIGLLGVAAVVGGFLLVLQKITRNYDFVWLIRRQLWTVAFAGFLYAILPVDAFVCEYNVRKVMAGELPPIVQITEHPTSAEGLLRLGPLVHCQDPIIRDGMRAMLAQKLDEAEAAAVRRQELGWTARQLAEDRLLEELQLLSAIWQNDSSQRPREAVLADFKKYAYQWY